MSLTWSRSSSRSRLFVAARPAFAGMANSILPGKSTSVTAKVHACCSPWMELA